MKRPIIVSLLFTNEDSLDLSQTGNEEGSKERNTVHINGRRKTVHNVDRGKTVLTYFYAVLKNRRTTYREEGTNEERQE